MRRIHTIARALIGAAVVASVSPNAQRRRYRHDQLHRHPLTEIAVTIHHATLTAGGVYRQGGTMTPTRVPISAHTANNSVGSVPTVLTCTG